MPTTLSLSCSLLVFLSLHGVSPSSAFPSCKICGVRRSCRRGWQAKLGEVRGVEGAVPRLMDRKLRQQGLVRRANIEVVRGSSGVRQRTATFSLKIRGKISIETTGLAPLTTILLQGSGPDMRTISICDFGYEWIESNPSCLVVCGPMILLSIARVPSKWAFSRYLWLIVIHEFSHLHATNGLVWSRTLQFWLLITIITESSHGQVLARVFKGNLLLAQIWLN